nr:TPA_asm: m69.1 uORF 2 [Murid betaherpesvirus 1]DBA07807.1 TPA_asm: m69.1 uORF 2 [Murid betaherpesvirus 1]
MRVAAA